MNYEYSLQIFLTLIGYNILTKKMKADSQLSVLKTFTLPNIRIVISKKQTNYCFALKEDSSQDIQLSPNLIAISFEIVIKEPLNECLKPRSKILEVGLKALEIVVDMRTKEGEFCFETMNYNMFVEASSNKHGDTCFVDITKIMEELRSTTLGLTIYVSRQKNVIQEAELLKEIYLLAGSNFYSNTCLFQISSFTMKILHSEEIPKQSHLPNKIRFIDHQYSLPLGLFSHPDQIYSSLNITTNWTLEAIENFISALPQYQAPLQENQNKLYFCHDMKGGYKQDLFFDHNTPSVLTNNPPPKQNMSYRCLHLQQSEVFNYFSHHNITVPPRHWRLLCKRYGTRCLGTFITEREDYSQNMLISKQLALFLVGLARKAGFDGYLLNIQRKISTISAFKKWVEYLTLKMHQFIPNSTVVWYDSILATTGQLHHQNALTRQNYQFYHFTDALFTNYWWNPQHLRSTIQLKGNNQRKVYVGNDCFGRGTYGGGKLNIFQAANTILENKGLLGIGLFAPGYTNEAAGENKILFHINESGLYKGVYTNFLEMDKWKESKANNMNGGWEKQGDEIVSSFGQCERSVTLRFSPLKDDQDIRIIFFCRVASTPPLFDSPYKIILQVLDENKIILLQSDTYNFFNYQTTKEQSVIATSEITVSSQTIETNNPSVKVIIMAQSKKKWSGFFGPRFSNEMVTIQTYDKERHWISKIPIKQVQLGQLFHSYCNTGVGNFFYSEGLPLQNNYDFLCDMDVPHTHIINSPLDVEWDYDKSFYGGSSLKVKKETIKLLKMVIPEGLNPKSEYYLQVTVKDTQGINVVCKYISKKEEDRVFTAKLMKSQEVNQWKKVTFRLVSNLSQIKITTRTMIELTSIKCPYWLGEIKLVTAKESSYNPIKCRLELSKDYIPSDHYYLHLSISSSYYQRLYVQIQKFGVFSYFSEGKALLHNIPIKKCESIDLQITDTDSSLDNTLLCMKTLDGSAISQLIFKGYLQF